MTRKLTMLELGFQEREDLTVRCAFCSWTRTGKAPAMLKAQREHREAKHPDARDSGKRTRGRLAA